MFYAYPNKPAQLGITIEAAVKNFNLSVNTIQTWKALEIAGCFIIDQIKTTIDEKSTFIADITQLNFNVTYEIGYAIGTGKPIMLTKNSGITEGDTSIREVGIFDTIGYQEYENSDELIELLRNPNTHILFKEQTKINKKAPVYLLETKHKSDFSARITARIKKARLIYRSFDPNEIPRLSAHDAIDQVSQSYGVVVHLLSKDSEDYTIHNMRAAFIAGLANGMNKTVTILQHSNDPVPIDYRDFVNNYFHPDDINAHIAEFANKIVEAFQGDDVFKENKEFTYLQELDLGASAAENEMRTLQQYYLKTEAFLKAARGEAQVVVGRKGSGKTAIFLQIRDKERSSGKNVVLDLKPEGYKLLKFKEVILDYLEEGTFQHTIMAFWEYILLLEICHKVLENDKQRYLNQTELYDAYRNLEENYKAEEYLTEGDFSERMSNLMEKLTVSYKTKYGQDKNVRLSLPEITDLIYNSDIKKLRINLAKYLKHKEKVWLLFDNIDKGWPSTGLKHEDFIIIRTLIDASRKIQRHFDKENIEIFPLIFLRNDVYELLVKETSDRQKEAIVLLDWIDPDLLRKIIELRIKSNSTTESDDFDEIWRKICISHYRGEETSQFLIEHSLMRPRFLINLINQCKGFAINLNHKIIEEEDIKKGLESFSVDLLTDIGYEIRDIFPESENILYNFIASEAEFSLTTLTETIKIPIKEQSLIDRIIDLLLWYGFLGIKTDNNEIKYIYNFNYNMQLLKGFIKKKSNQVVYCINPGFWASLLINEE